MDIIYALAQELNVNEKYVENVVQLSVPLTAEAHWGRNWLEAKG